MIGKKINQLATELAPASTDLTIIGDPISGVSKKITIAQLGAIFSGAVSFYDNFAAFPATGDINVIYCAKDTKKLYLWSGSAYVEVFPSQALLDTYQLRSEKGVSNGYASLDSTGKVPISQLPSSIMEYKGTWNAATNTPTLANGTGDTGDVYICNVAGTVNFGAGPITFAVGDYTIYSGSIWQRSSGAVGTVTSVAASITGNAIGITGSPVTTSGTLAFAFAGTGAQYIKGDGTLATFPNTIAQAERLITEVYNSTGATLTKGTIVYINGGQGNLPTVTKALATGDSTSAQTFGVVQADITNNNNGYVVVAGKLSDLDTQAYTPGTPLYLSSTTAGTWTSTKQYAPNHLVYIGVVVRAHPTQGIVEVKIQNGYELDELHNVAAQTPTNNDGLFWESATSLWKNKSISTILGYTPQAQLNGTGFVKASGTTITYDNNTYVTIDTFENITASKNFTVGLSLGSAGGTNQASVFANTNSIYSGSAGTNIFGFNTSNNIYFGKGLSNGGVIAWNNSTSRTYNLPDADGTIALVGGSGIGTVTSVAALTIGTTGTDITSTVANSTTTPVITLNVPTASATNRGALSSADWTTFNNKQNTLTNPVTGTGTTNYIAKFTGTSTIGNSLVFDNGTNVGIGTNSPTFLLDVNGTLRASANVTGTDNVAVFHNTNTTTSGTPVIALSTASTGIDAPADIRLAGTNTKGIRIYAADSTLTSTPLGAGFQMFSVSSTNFPGQMFFDSGANNSAFIAFRTTVTSGTITERMRITASGNVGIGTTSPNTILDVNGTINVRTNGFEFGRITTNNVTGNIGGLTFQYNASGTFTTGMVLNGGGNLGIGTASPGNRLSILAADETSNPTLGTNAGKFGIFNGVGAGNYGMIMGVINNGNSYLQVQRIDGIATAYNLLLQPSGGNVGIGTTSPTQKLTIGATNGYPIIDFYNSGTGFGDIGYNAGTTSFNLSSYSTTPLAIYTNGSERMRITSGGNLLVNNTSSVGSKLIVRGDSTTSGGYACILWDSANTDLFYVRNDGYIVTGTGANSPCNTTTTNASNLHVFTSNGALARSTASSARFKENIKDWQESGLNTILSLKPKTFTYKANYYSNPELQMLGLIAEEVAKVSPFLAEYENEDRTGQVENVRYANIVVPLIKAVQELKAELDTLKNK